MRITSLSGQAALIAVALSAGCASSQLDAASSTPSPVAPAQATAAPSSPAQADPEPNAWVSAPPEVYRAPTSSRSLLSGASMVIGEPAPPPEPTRPAARPRIKVNFQ